jgi:NAD(P)-dependent dehydrogenase (short-subunit alcohol dehydrogenase family)
LVCDYRVHFKKAAVTGASQGLGEAIAIALAEAGLNIVIVVDKNISGAKRNSSL